MSKLEHYTSIVVTSYVSDYMRASMFNESINSLLNSVAKAPCEIIIVDNGGSHEVSKGLDEFLRLGKIQCLIKNSSNLHFGMARQMGLAAAKGEYIVIADNDIYFREGWLEALWAPLDEYPARKLYSTCIAYPTGFYKERYDQGKLDVEGKEYELNMRAGSNCFMVRRRDLEIIGGFSAHRIAGTRWTDRAVKAGYLAAVAPGKLCFDLGLRLGYNHHQAIPIKRYLTNGKEVHYNIDEFKKHHPNLYYEKD